MMPDVPDIYCDQFTMAHNPYGVIVTFGLTSNMPNAQSMPVPQVVVRMSLEHAKVMAMVIRKTLKQYELEHLGDPIKIPQALAQQLHFADGDW